MDRKKIVVVQLSGGNDYLNCVIPYEDPNYLDNRPNVRLNEDQVIPIGQGLAMNPAMAPIKELYDQGKVAILHGTGYPDPNRSHFRSMDIWHTAEPTKVGNEGWLGVINDSKKLSESKRQMAYEIISREAVSVAVGITNASTIDSVGILPATISSMFTALRGLEVYPDFVLFDFIPLKDCEYPYRTVVKGDTKSYSISAASIIAKVTRDELMKEAEEQYPGYGFSGHKGYGTAKHLDAIKRLGPCEIHRRSFAPIKNYVRI